MIHKTTTYHSEEDNEFVGKVVEFEKYWQLEEAKGRIWKFPKGRGEVEFSEEIKEK
jgi:hypothetical protein